MTVYLDDPEVKLTYDWYIHLPDDGKQHELINGRHYMNAAPVPRHQTVSRKLQYQLMQQLEFTGLAQVFNAPIDVQFDDFNVVQPDIAVVLNENDIIIETRIKGAPNLIVEILSPSTRDRDLLLKKPLYELHRVEWFWIVDPVTNFVDVHRMNADWKYAAPDRYCDRFRVEIGGRTVEIDLSKVW